MILVYLLGYLWTCLTTVPGLLLFLLAKALGWVLRTDRRGPAFLVQLRGPLARWMQTPSTDVTSAGAVWYGHTVGPFVFLYVTDYASPSEQQISHERRHVTQQMVLGPFHILIYAVSYLWGLIRYRDGFCAYYECILERDARRVAGEDE